MSNVIISYDVVEGEQHRVREGLLKKEWCTNVIHTRNGMKLHCTLPNTTLWKKDITPEEAYNEILSIVVNKQSLKRFIATTEADAFLIEGKKF